MTIDVGFLVQSIISMLVITLPLDPIKILFFNRAIADPPRDRTRSAAKVALYVAIILGVTVLVGRELLDLLGIDLNAFSVVGGLIITLMGFEMLHGGGTSKAQGEDHRQVGPEEDDALLIPLTLPLIAGPGAITTAITISASQSSSEGIIVALIAVGVVVLTAFIAYALLGEAITKIRPATISVVARIGGLLLATIGVQMMLGGLDRFFA